MPAITSSDRPQLSVPNEILLLAQAQWLFKEDELMRTPSILAGLAPADERKNRVKGVGFILQVGIMLKLPQITLATASVFLHRFYMRQSMIDDKVAGKQGMHYYSIAATCLFLATKVEENCRKMKELVMACVRVAQKEPHKLVDEQDKEYWKWRDTILAYEDQLLEAICFDLTLELPYKVLFEFLVYFEVESDKRVRNSAWAFLNDSCATMLCLLFPSRTIAASALYAAARHCEVRIPDDGDGRPWWDVVNVKLLDLRRACNYMADCYENMPTKGDGPVYQRTPEDTDPLLAKTRLRLARSSDPTQVSPSAGRRGSDTSTAASDISKKRPRDRDDPFAGGSGTDSGSGSGSEFKKRKVLPGRDGHAVSRLNPRANGVDKAKDMDQHTNGVGGGDGDEKPLQGLGLEDGREEGEVAS